MSSAKNITATIGAIIHTKGQRNDIYSKFLIYRSVNSYYNIENSEKSERNFTYEKYC